MSAARLALSLSLPGPGQQSVHRGTRAHKLKGPFTWLKLAAPLGLWDMAMDMGTGGSLHMIMSTAACCCMRSGHFLEVPLGR